MPNLRNLAGDIDPRFELPGPWNLDLFAGFPCTGLCIWLPEGDLTRFPSIGDLLDWLNEFFASANFRWQPDLLNMFLLIGSLCFPFVFDIAPGFELKNICCDADPKLLWEKEDRTLTGTGLLTLGGVPFETVAALAGGGWSFVAK
eukprot:TRINITY_DN4850_c0_g1_i3.p4 TRINITY_DN4850_c0_g1~~TRINITY_DN4850_c0_g1_i3.p4  ORF type:complete len:145 (+),score=31.43 TRINITY_DN4850_c0_g1_i3:556-990(+)